MEEFKKNIKNNLTLFCARSLEALENPYSGLSDVQIKIVNSKIEEAKKIMELV